MTVFVCEIVELSNMSDFDTDDDFKPLRKRRRRTVAALHRISDEEDEVTSSRDLPELAMTGSPASSDKKATPAKRGRVSTRSSAKKTTPTPKKLRASDRMRVRKSEPTKVSRILELTEDLFDPNDEIDTENDEDDDAESATPLPKASLKPRQGHCPFCQG